MKDQVVGQNILFFGATIRVSCIDVLVGWSLVGQRTSEALPLITSYITLVYRMIARKTFATGTQEMYRLNKIDSRACLWRHQYYYS
jgi:hypothetical protein